MRYKKIFLFDFQRIEMVLVNSNIRNNYNTIIDFNLCAVVAF